MMDSRLGGEQRLRELARAARSAPPGPEPSRPLDVVLDALAVRLTDGYEAGLLPARRALASCIEEAEPNQQFLQWLWFGPLLAPEIWDDERWDSITAHIVRLARDAGAFGASSGRSRIPRRVRAVRRQPRHGNGATPGSRHDRRTDRYDGRSCTCQPRSPRGAGNEARALELIDATIELMGGRTGRNIGLAENARAVLFTGQGRYDDAFAAAQRAVRVRRPRPPRALPRRARRGQRPRRLVC